MMANDKAADLLQLYGKKIALEISKMILEEHDRYESALYVWRNEFQESYYNTDMCRYWRDVINFIEASV